MKDIHDESTWPVWANETIELSNQISYLQLKVTGQLFN